MPLFAISDLHLSHAVNKPMDEFGEVWKNHSQKIKFNWENNITNDDTVIIAGDISWALHEEEAYADLDFLNKLPGTKILSKGNHDYWWNSTSSLNSKYKTLNFIKNSYSIYKEYAVCGTKGWICPNDSLFTRHDEKLYKREIIRLKFSLDMAVKDGYDKIIAILHFPPTNDKKESSGFTELMEAYNVSHVVYGHLHGQHSFNNGLQGEFNNINYYLTSGDYLNFKPLRLL